MSSLLRDSLKREKELDDEMKEALTKKIDYFICYLCTAHDVMKDSEKLEFHNVADAARRDRKTVFGRNEVVLYGTAYSPFGYLMRAWSEGFPNTGFEKALTGIEESPINGRITPEMIMKRYDEYKEMLVECSNVKTARKKFLNGLGMQY